MADYAQKYSSMYRPSLNQLLALRGNRGQDRAARGQAQMMNTVGAALPAVGALAGGVTGGLVGSIVPGLGTATGASLGAGLGSAAYGIAGSALQNRGEEQLDPQRERELRRQALMDALAGYR